MFQEPVKLKGNRLQIRLDGPYFTQPNFHFDPSSPTDAQANSLAS